MINIGSYNTLTAVRSTEHGWYLTDTEQTWQVLLPACYVDDNISKGSRIEVFVYTDSDDRPVATTLHPIATVGEFAYLDTAAVTPTGAFMKWGLPKDLLIPFSEQKATIHHPGRYLAYIFLDHASGRIAATTKIEKYLGNVLPRYSRGKKVECLVYRVTPIGLACIVDNLHRGMLYSDSTFRTLEVGDRITAYVQKVRPDGKIDLTLNIPAGQRTAALSKRILAAIERAPQTFALCDRSEPEEIREAFECSKRDFKQAIGHLLKDGKIAKTERGYSLPVKKK